MKCQHCNQNEATAYIKKNVNGKVTEMHLCSECASELGVMDEFSVEGFFKDSFLGSLLGAGIPSVNALSGVDRCEYCGSLFNDIVKNGRVGCAHCYSKFEDKLEPSIVKIHGKTNHVGKNISYTEVDEEKPKKDELSGLKDALKAAIKEQRFEDAAVLRDKIKELGQEA